MTEQEWLNCTDPQKMLEFLHDKASDRKLRLFAVACCRRIWNLLIDPQSKEAVVVAEQYADRVSNRRTLRSTQLTLRGIEDKSGSRESHIDCAFHAAKYTCSIQKNLHKAATMASWAIFYANSPGNVATNAEGEEESKQCDLIRDIFGLLPFRPLLPKKGRRTWEGQQRGWLGWNEGVIRRMAEGVYNDRALDRLPILADALEDAGCTDADILDHLRGPGPHVRGCFVLDLLLNKK